MLKRCGIAAAAACTTLAAAGPAQAGTTWTAVPSGTTADITAIDYQSDARAWFTTSDGRIFRTVGGAFVPATGTLPGAVYTDIAFQLDGPIGLAVTGDGRLQRSVDGGASWSTVVLTQTYRSCVSATRTAVARLHAVFWAGPSTAYYVGGGGTNQPIVLRSTEPVATPSDVNTIAPGGGCRVGGGTTAVTDGMALPADPGNLRFVTDDFGEVFTSVDALASPALVQASMATGAGGVPRLAVDPSNPSRIWVTSTNGGFTYAAGGSGRLPVRRVADGLPVAGALYDVAFAGGTVVAVGDGGAILTSVDGVTAHRQPAGGGLEATAWRAVDLGDATHALVGGAGGVLVRSANANAIPDTTAPTATISGPSSATVGQAVTFTASVADEPGGSGVDPASLAWSALGLPGASGASATFAFATPGPNTVTFAFRDLAGNAATATKSVFVSPARPPVTPPGPPARRRGAGSTPPNATGGTTQATTGGARVAAWKRIALSKGRYVPVRVSARSPRRFVVEIRRAKRPRTRVAMSKARLARGSKLVKVPLRPTVKTGKYRIVVRVYKGRRAVGRRVTLAFVLVR